MELNTLLPNQGIPSGYLVEKFTDQPGVYTLVTYPVSSHRTPGNYAPLREAKLIDCAILTQWGGTEGSLLGPILNRWKEKGFSSDWIVAQVDGKPPIAIRWVDSNVSKAQMDDGWNPRALGIIAQTDSSQNVSDAQIKCIGDILKHADLLYLTKIAYLGDWREARDPHSKEGMINNINTVRKMLDLSELPAELCN